MALEIPTIGSANSVADPKTKSNFETLSGLLGGSNKVKAAGLEADAMPFDWYAPKVIATEESRTNTSYGTLTTADEIKEVVVPENGILEVGFLANFKSSTSGAGEAAIFVGENQLKRFTAGPAPVVQAASSVGTEFHYLRSTPTGLDSTEATSIVTTGLTFGKSLVNETGGFCQIFKLPGGTYTVSIRYKSASGSVTAKERTLWVMVRGV